MENNATDDQSSTRSNVSTAIEGAAGFTMVVLLQLLQVESQNNGKSLFHNHPIHMIIFSVSLFTYVSSLYIVKKQVTKYLSLFEDICIFSGIVGCDALLSIMFPPLGYIAASFSILLFLRMVYVKYLCQIDEILCDDMLRRLRGMRLVISPTAGATGVDGDGTVPVPVTSPDHIIIPLDDEHDDKYNLDQHRHLRKNFNNDNMVTGLLA
ncbi:hypothetical protein ACFE04_031337 [Oxalis oulophora]